MIPLQSDGMDVRRAASIWMIMMTPHDLEMEDILMCSLIPYHVSNVRYFKAQEFAHEHHDEEWEINDVH